MDLFGEEYDPYDDAEGMDADAPQKLEHHTPANGTLFGHTAALETLIARVQAGTPPASLILSGAEGIGKATFVAHFISRLFNVPVPERADDGVNISAFGGFAHPDVLLVERAFDEKKGERKTDIVRDDVAGVAPFLRRTASTPNGYRLVVVDDANCMNLHAQNTLLKILEEPPAKSMIVLVTHSVGQLIQTIRSRCQVLELPPLSNADVLAVLKGKGLNLNASEQGFWQAYAQGAPGRILNLVEETKGEGVEQLFALINETMGLKKLAQFERAEKLAALPYAETLYSLLLFVLNRVALALSGDPQALNGLLPYLPAPTQSAFEQAGAQKVLDVTNNLAAFVALCQHARLDKKHTALGVVTRLAEGF